MALGLVILASASFPLIIAFLNSRHFPTLPLHYMYLANSGLPLAIFGLLILALENIGIEAGILITVIGAISSPEKEKDVKSKPVYA